MGETGESERNIIFLSRGKRIRNYCVTGLWGPTILPLVDWSLTSSLFPPFLAHAFRKKVKKSGGLGREVGDCLSQGVNTCTPCAGGIAGPSADV